MIPDGNVNLKRGIRLQPMQVLSCTLNRNNTLNCLRISTEKWVNAFRFPSQQDLTQLVHNGFKQWSNFIIQHLKDLSCTLKAKSNSKCLNIFTEKVRYFI